VGLAQGAGTGRAVDPIVSYRARRVEGRLSASDNHLDSPANTSGKELNDMPPSQARQAALLAIRITDRETFYWLVGRDTKLPSLTSVPKSPARLPVRDHKLLPTLKAA